jgi:hypothetical protein
MPYLTALRLGGISINGGASGEHQDGGLNNAATAGGLCLTFMSSSQRGGDA